MGGIKRYITGSRIVGAAVVILVLIAVIALMINKNKKDSPGDDLLSYLPDDIPPEIPSPETETPPTTPPCEPTNIQ